MAERSMHKYTYSITLTYADDTQFNRDGAAMFRYSDIEGFMKRLRRSIDHHSGKGHAVRFLCAGEYGDREQRCHWHILLFSDYDILTRGAWTAPWGAVSAREDIISPPDKEYRRSWSLWPHGFVLVQQPDQAGVAYVVDYALKDQFNLANSQDTARSTRSEVYATGYFAQSRRPALGQPYLASILDDFSSKGYCMPTANIDVPDMTGYWYPRGTLREYYLTGVAQINADYRLKNGHNLPQWSTLLHSCADSETDLEYLLGTSTEQEHEQDFESEQYRLDKSIRWKRQELSARKWARRCGSTLPCTSCLASISAEALRALGLCKQPTENGLDFFFEKRPHETIAPYQSDGKNSGCNSYCELRGTIAHKGVFYAKQSS